MFLVDCFSDLQFILLDSIKRTEVGMVNRSEDGGQASDVVFWYSEKTGGRDEDVGLLFRSSMNGQGQE